MQINTEAWREMIQKIHGLSQSCPINIDNIDADIIMFSMSPKELLVLADICLFAQKAYTRSEETKEITTLRFRGVPLKRDEYSRVGDRRHE